ncbi:MAG TPA: rod shape-determining protein MreC [Actinomycetota bacterium]|nr:rod shape-determining protein MreC [Actinomycetota bacterium]
MYRRAGRGRLLLFAFLALCIVVITLDFRQNADGPLERGKDIASAVVAPLQRGFTAVTRPVGNFFSSLGDLGRLRTENTELKASVEEMEGRLTEALSLTDENERLRNLLELEESWASMDRTSAEVIGYAPANYKWAVFIDKGRNDGVENDMSVVNSEGLVGKVIRVEAATSTVLLLIDPQAGARARTEDRGQVGVIHGNGEADRLLLERIDTDAQISVGQDVVTAGYDQGIFPPSIPIGEVMAVSTQGAALHQEVEVRPWVDFDSLDFVSVLLESGPRLDRGED